MSKVTPRFTLLEAEAILGHSAEAAPDSQRAYRRGWLKLEKAICVGRKGQ